jgi:beta-lactamase class A
VARYNLEMPRRRAFTALMLLAVAGCSSENEPLGASSDNTDEVDAGSRETAGDGGAPQPESDAQAPVDAAPPNPILQKTLDALGPKCGQLSQGTSCSLSVIDVTTGETASWRGTTTYISASSVKAVWVAVAMKDTSIEKVAPLVTPVFADSDNEVSGQVIDLLSSPDRINTFMWNEAGMKNSGYCSWGFGGKPRKATNCKANVAGGNNFFTSDDGALFMSAVWKKTLLGEAKSAKLLEWMKLSPRKDYGGWLGTQLPEAARASMAHKAGWLPPPYSSRITNEIGLVQVSPTHAYAVGIAMAGGSNYDGKQLPTVEYASCVIYHAVARDQADPFTGCKTP